MNLGPMQFREITSLDDESLMVRVRDQDCLSSFAELFERWKEKIHRANFRMIGNWQDAEDSTQEVFGKLYRNRHNYQVHAKFGTYLWQIAINQTRDLVRKNSRYRRKQEALGNQIDQECRAATEIIEIQDEVQNALLSLPDSFREVVVLRHYEGLKFKQIAALLSISPGTVASRMARALQLLERQLNSRDPIVP